MEPKPTTSPKEALIILLLALATALKATWALNSAGSCDLVLFYVYGRVLEDNTLAQFYQTAPLFNHTPLTGCVIEGISRIAHGDYNLFGSLLRMLSVLADIVVVIGLLYVRRVTGRPPWWALGLFAVSPVSIIISGFHGNIDPIMTALLFLAAVAVLRDRPVWSGVLFAAACNVKVMPLLFGPLFAFYWYHRGWRPLARFLVPAGGLLALGMAWPLVQCPGPFMRNVLSYSSLWGTWGVSYWLRETGLPDFQKVDFRNFTGPQAAVIGVLKALAIGSVLALGWRRRAVKPEEFFTTLGAALALVFVFAPGAGSHYMVWWGPFLLLLSPSWWSAMTAAATVYLVRFYHSASDYKFPWDKADPRMPQFEEWAPWTNLVWALFIALTLWQGATWYLAASRQPKEETAHGEEPARAVA